MTETTSKKPTILLLSTTLDVGGCEKMVYELARSIDKQRFTVVIAALIGEGNYGWKLHEEGFDVTFLKMRGYWDLSVFKKLGYLIRERNVTLIHSFLFHANIVGRIAAFMYKVPYNISSVRTMERGALWHVAVDILTKPLVHFELTNSELVRSFMIKKTFSNPDHIRTVHNGVRCAEFPHIEEKARIKQELGIEAGQQIIGTVGCLEKAKGHDIFIALAKKVLKVRDDITFVIVGEGSLRPKLERMVRRAKLEHKIILTGFRSDAVAVMSIFNVFLLTSRWEGFPNVILEAMSQRVPVLSTDVGGISELIRDGENGELFKVNEIDRFAERVVSILSAPLSREKYAFEGYRTVVENFPLDDTIHQTMAVYQDLMGSF